MHTMKLLTIAASLLLTLQLISACPNSALKLHTASGFTPPDTAYVLTKDNAIQNNNNKAINVHQGEDILIQLKSNPGGTGFSWQFDKDLQNKFATSEHHDIEYKYCSYRHPVQAAGSRPLIGSAGNDFFWFHIATDAAVNTNPFSIKLKYVRPNEPDTDVSENDIMEFKLNVLPKANN